MGGYDAKSCSALQKLHYRPVDAALRLCGLIAHEVKILTATGEAQYPPLGAFPQWPCLRTNIEAIIDAIENGDLPHGRDGKTVAQGDQVAVARRTIRHSDLKAWVIKNRPSHKPEFLFDDVERTTHAAINADSFRALQVDRDAARATIEVAREWAEKKVEELNALRAERDSLATQVKGIDPLDPRERKTLLTIIAALAKEAKINIDPPGKAAGYIEGLTAELGARVSKRAIEDHLKKIPDALETRMK